MDSRRELGGRADHHRRDDKDAGDYRQDGQGDDEVNACYICVVIINKLGPCRDADAQGDGKALGEEGDEGIPHFGHEDDHGPNGHRRWLPLEGPAREDHHG